MLNSTLRWVLPAVAATLLPLAACTEKAELLTGPAPVARLNSVPAKPPSEPGTRLPDAKAGLVICDLAVHSHSGGYRVSTVPVHAPRAIFGGDTSATRRFAFVAWEQNGTDPARVLVCRIPATALALEYFKNQFIPQFQSAGRPRAYLSKLNPDLSAAAVQDVVLYEGNDYAPCTPEMLICDCPNGPGTCPDNGQEWEGPPPAVEGDPAASDVLTPDGTVVDANGAGPAIINCNSRIDNIHFSSHVPGTLNVVANTTCTFPMGINVSVTLSKQSCIWFFCWMTTKGSGVGGNLLASASSATANAAAPCEKGHWRGASTHYMIPPLGYFPPTTIKNVYTYAYVGWC